MLRKKNRIKTLVGTLEIEGNFLSEEKITALMNGKRVLGTVPEIAESTRGYKSLPTESIVNDYQEEYYKALEDSTALGESTPFIEFMLEMILQTVIKVGNEVGNRVGNLTDNQIMIIEFMKNNSKMSAKKLSDEIGISVRKIEENISKLKKLDIINRVGGTRGYWEIKG